MVSLVGSTQEGNAIEVGTIGNEGVVGGFVALGSDRSASAALVQIGGEFLRITLADFRVELERSRSLAEVVQRFAHALTNQISQSLVCNQMHSVEERICRWLLMAHDRVGKDELDLTQDFIAQMLGIRRATVTVVAGLLQKAGLIQYTRGHITVLDRQGLHAEACECYDMVRRETERLLSHQH
jgi:CRP-like cAMP-binding protein